MLTQNTIPGQIEALLILIAVVTQHNGNIYMNSYQICQPHYKYKPLQAVNAMGGVNDDNFHFLSQEDDYSFRTSTTVEPLPGWRQADTRWQQHTLVSLPPAA